MFMKKSFRIISLLIISLFLLTGLSFADPLHPKNPLENAVDLKMVKLHQYMLQEIAKHNDNNRLAGTPGYDQSARYIASWLKYAGYKPVIQEFEFPFFQELSVPIFNQTAPNAVTYPPDVPEGFMTLTYSGSDNVTGVLQGVDLIIPIGDNPPGTCNSGCEPEDFAGFTPGNIALLQRGTCTFAVKIANAQAAGAVAAIIVNEGQPGRVDAIRGTLGGPDFTIPAVFANYNIGVELFDLMQAGTVQVNVNVNAISEIRKTHNVIADTPGGADNNIVIVGAHLDSAAEGPGINDNGSGSAAILEVATKMGWLHIKPKYKVRFAFFSAEEEGLLGSEFYAASLTPEELAKISMNLNFDMIASHNYVRFVYDGDGSDTPTPGPAGSEQIEKLFNDYFTKLGLPTDPTALDGRSDYDSFAIRDIPVGGLFSGADSIKTAEQALKYGGTAGEQCDSCYHTACDNMDNLNYTIEKQMLKAIAYAIYTYGKTPLTPPLALKAYRAAAYQSTYKGPLAVR
jgi:Zn-dependent M28 family amino/carboxypeptidase